MSAADDDRDEREVTADLLEELTEQAQVLGVFDEGQDIALDLHEELFSPATRQRALDFLSSDRYQTAVQKFQHLQRPTGGGR